MLSAISRRCLHITRTLLSEETVGVISKLGKGKKLPAGKQQIVILDAEQSRLVRHVPRFFRSDGNRKLNEKKLQLVNSAELAEQRSKLTRDDSKITNEQSVRRINQMRPSKTLVSNKRYEQIVKELSTVFTIAQLRDYIQAEFPEETGYKTITKPRVIHKILHQCWGLEISEQVDPESDLVLQREFDLSQRELYLLLTQNTFEKWIRANVKIIVLPEELRVIVRSSKSHLQYIELALGKILENIATAEMELDSLIQYLKLQNKSLPIDQIQRLSGVFFEQVENGNTSSEYKVYSLGTRNFSPSRRLILWSLENNPFIKDLTMTNFEDAQSPDVKYFNHFLLDSLPWIYQNRNWARLQTPRTKDFLPLPVNLDVDKIYEDLTKHKVKELNKPNGFVTQSLTAVTFGQVLHEVDSEGKPKKSILNTQLPFARNLLQSLPLYQFEENLEDEFIDTSLDVSQDYHSYFAQIKFVPSPFEVTEVDDGKRKRYHTDVKNFLEYPPLEFWFEVDERDCAKIDTLQVVLTESETNSTVLLPSNCTDLKFIKSSSMTLVDPVSNTSSDQWLSDQPGIKRALSHASLNFSGSKAVKVPDFVDVKLPGVDQPVRYAYVSLSYRRHLNYKFNDRLLQFAVVESGALGGRTMELIMVGSENEIVTGEAIEAVDDKKELKEFVDDVAKLVDQLEAADNSTG